jgi:hypothetical protein
LPLEFLVFPHVAGDHLADLPRAQQFAQAEVVHSRVIGDGREVPRAGRQHGVDQGFWDAAQSEASDGNELSISDQPRERSFGAGIHLVHS